MSVRKGIDILRFFLISLMILIHIVHFNDVHPTLKPYIYFLSIPPFMTVTGYLFNPRKPWPKFRRAWLQWLGLYAVMETAYAVASCFLPVRDALPELTLPALLNALFVKPIGVYWYLHTMLICQAVAYVCHVLSERIAPLLTIAVVALLVEQTPLLWFIAYFFCLGQFLRLIPVEMEGGKTSGNIPENLSGDTPRIQSENPSNYLGRTLLRPILYIGRNTLPIYIFHPLFTLASKPLVPLFAFDSTALFFTLFTLVLSIAGSLGLARLLEITRLSRLLFREKLLR